MGKKSREKRERLERIRLGTEQPTDKEQKKIEQKQQINNAILNNFGIGVTPNFTLMNFQNSGEESFSGPYFLG